MHNAQLKMEALLPSLKFKLLFIALLRVRVVGRDDEDRLRSFARRYLAIYAHLGLTNRISTYN